MNPKKIRVVICDPDEQKNELLESMLNTVGVNRVTAVTEFSEISHALEEEKPNMIIMGDEFGELKPVEILRYLKIEPLARGIPVLLHSDSEDVNMVRELVEEGLVATIPFPPSKATVQRALRDYMRRLTSKEIGRLVQTSEFFGEFTKEELKTLAQIAIPRIYHAGETIFEKGDPGDAFYILLKGRIETLVVQGPNRSMSITIDEGSPFGEMAILGNCPRSAFCVAADESIVLEIGSHIINDHCSVLRNKVMAKLAEILADRLRRMNEMPPEAPAPEPPAALYEEEEEEEGVEKGSLSDNPYTVPLAKTDLVDTAIQGQEEYDVLKRKINLRADFILNKIPRTVREMIGNKMYGYWTGGKLAKLNPHQIWSEKRFMPGSTRLKRAMHIVAICPHGTAAYVDAYLGLPFSHRVVGLSDTGCSGTFIGSEDALNRFLNNEPLSMALESDLEIPIDRYWRGNECIEYLTHTSEDVRPETLFLIFDKQDGKVTRRIREAFPETQIVTVVEGFGFNPDEPSTFFTYCEELMKAQKVLVTKKEESEEGFYMGETFFIPDLSEFYAGTDKMDKVGYIFGTIGVFAMIGPDYSGITWGSKGGAEGAVRAARAMYGMKGAQSSEDLANAVSWADN